MKWCETVDRGPTWKEKKKRNKLFKTVQTSPTSSPNLTFSTFHPQWCDALPYTLTAKMVWNLLNYDPFSSLELLGVGIFTMM